MNFCQKKKKKCTAVEVGQTNHWTLKPDNVVKQQQ